MSLAFALTFDIVTAPAAWAPALVNGDYSDLELDDIIALETWQGGLDGRVIDTAGEAWFTWAFGLYGGHCGGGDVISYVVEH